MDNGEPVRKEPGPAPGSRIYTGPGRDHPARIYHSVYNATTWRRELLVAPTAELPAADEEGTTWLQVCGIHDLTLIEALGRQYDIHPLVLEDIVHPHQRPKQEEYDRFLFIVLPWIDQVIGEEGLVTEQVSMVLTRDKLISFQESEEGLFDPVIKRLEQGRGRIRKAGPAYLAYALVDTVLDHYFDLEDNLRRCIDSLQEEITSDHRPDHLQRIFALRRAISQLRGTARPLLELTAQLEREELDLLPPPTQPFLRDLHDHSLQLKESVEILHEMVAGLQDLYLSLVSNRMNSVMQVLSIIATIFIPLTFLAGLYGMNFKHMPELEWKWSYPALLVVMAILGVAMTIMFKRRRWF